MSHRKRRTERSADGADENDMGYGNITAFSRQLSIRLREKGMAMDRKDWGHQGSSRQKKTGK